MSANECPECFSPIELRILDGITYRFCTNAFCDWRGPLIAKKKRRRRSRSVEVAQRFFTDGRDICNPKGIDTSAQAHRRTRPSKKGTYQKIINHIVANGPHTTAELEEALVLARSTASSRCSELLADGVLLRTGDKRPTKTGSPAHVLAVHAGRAQALGFDA